MYQQLPAIVVVAFDRPNALNRLLDSIKAAKYDSRNVPLIISVDGAGNPEVIDVAHNFIWHHGTKRLIIHEQNYGLRKHVLKCGSLSSEYGSIIMLEEDCFVSPNFYRYSIGALDFYKNDDRIAGISLYSYSFNENALLPFYSLKDGNDVFFMQVPSSWGQAWTEDQWQKFMEFYNQNPKITENDRLPEKVKKWPESSWKKYFYKYLVMADKFIVYPQTSLTTNYGDAGTHYTESIDIWQVPLDCRESDHVFVPFQQSNNKYDGYFEILPDCIGLSQAFIIDLYGTKQLCLFDGDYAFSIKDCTDPIEFFGRSLKPSFLNIRLKIKGNTIALARTSDFDSVNSQTTLNLLKDVNIFVFKAGRKKGKLEGYEYGKRQIKHSKTYRVGNFLLFPIKMLRKKQ